MLIIALEPVEPARRASERAEGDLGEVGHGRSGKNPCRKQSDDGRLLHVESESRVILRHPTPELRPC